MIRAAAALGLILALAAPGHADTTSETFLGWAADGTFYATVYKNEVGEFGSLCAANAGTRGSWPRDYGWPQGGSTCVSALHVARAELAKLVQPAQATPAGKPSLRGLTLSFALEKTDEFVTGVVTVSGGKPKRSQVFRYEEGMAGAKLGQVFWQPGETAVAFIIDSKSGRAVYHEDLTTLVAPLPAAPATPASAPTAAGANAEGEAWVKAKDWPKAEDAFRRAIAADASLVIAHYNLALAAARVDNLDEVLAELTWLRTSTNGSAKSHLKRAFDDPAFDGWAADKQVRELFGRVPWPQLGPVDRLMDRRGDWSSRGLECHQPSVTLTFKKDGRVRLHFRDQCHGKTVSRYAEGLYAPLPADATFPGTKKKGPVVVSFKPLREWPALPESAWVDWCPEHFRGSAPCLTLRGPGFKEIETLFVSEPVLRPEPN